MLGHHENFYFESHILREGKNLKCFGNTQRALLKLGFLIGERTERSLSERRQTCTRQIAIWR